MVLCLKAACLILLTNQLMPTESAAFDRATETSCFGDKLDERMRESLLTFYKCIANEKN